MIKLLLLAFLIWITPSVYRLWYVWPTSRKFLEEIRPFIVANQLNDALRLCNKQMESDVKTPLLAEAIKDLIWTGSFSRGPNFDYLNSINLTTKQLIVEQCDRVDELPWNAGFLFGWRKETLRNQIKEEMEKVATILRHLEVVRKIKSKNEPL